MHLSSKNKTLKLSSLLYIILNLNKYYIALKTFKYINKLLLKVQKGIT
jgi:hypothetical protein